VPEETIRRRYVRSVRNFFDLYRPLAATWEVIDNTTPGRPTIVAVKRHDEDMIIRDLPVWQAFERHRHESDES